MYIGGNHGGGLEILKNKWIRGIEMVTKNKEIFGDYRYVNDFKNKGGILEALFSLKRQYKKGWKKEFKKYFVRDTFYEVGIMDCKDLNGYIAVYLKFGGHKKEDAI